MTQPTRQALPDPNRLLATALRLAVTGIPVFPCVPDAKRPLTSHGLLDATTNIAKIRDWWHRHPTANLAMPTGATSFDVLDVDVHLTGSGYPAYNQLNRAGLLDGYSTLIATPSGGLHVYFTGTEQPSARLPNLHIDFKASGGYVLTPPSVVAGHPYELIRSASSQHQALNWAAIRDHLGLTDPKPVLPARGDLPRGIEQLAAWVARLPEGQRNTGTFWAACRATEQGVADLRPLIDAAVHAGLPRQEATRTVTSAVRRITAPTPPMTAPSPSIPPARTWRTR